MDKSPQQFGYIKDGIAVKVKEGVKNNNWLVFSNSASNAGVIKNKSKNVVAVAKKSASKTKPSFPVSLPKQVYLNAMQNQKTAEFKMPAIIRKHGHRPPPPPNQLTRPPSPFTSTSSLRTVRHPVPTGKKRTTIADKYEQQMKNPQTIYPNSTNTNIDNISPPPPLPAPPLQPPPLLPQIASAANKQPAEDKYRQDKIKTLTNETATKPGQGANLSDSISMKHRLPVALAPTKACKRSQISSSGNMECKSNNCNNTQVPLMSHAITQTEKIFIVTEEEIKTLQKVKSRNISDDDFQILELLKKSAATKEEIETQLSILKRQKENIIIDLENDSVENSEAIEKCFKHSDNNKNIILAAMEVAKHLHNIELPSTIPIPEENSAATSKDPSTINADRPYRPATPFPKNTININEQTTLFSFLNNLARAGIRVTSCDNLEQTRTMDSNQCTQAEDENNNKKRRTSIEVHPVDNEVNENTFQQAPLNTFQSQSLQQAVQIPQLTDLIMIRQSKPQSPEPQLSQAPHHHSLLIQPPQFHPAPLQASQHQSSHIRVTRLQSPQKQTQQFQSLKMQPSQFQQQQLQSQQMETLQFHHSQQSLQSPQTQPHQYHLSQLQSQQMQTLQCHPSQLQSPQTQPPQYHPSRLQSQQMQTPQFNPSQLQSPQTQPHQYHPPQSQLSQMQTAQFDPPQKKLPQIQTAQFHYPHLQSPQMQAPQYHPPQPQPQEPQITQLPQSQDQQTQIHPVTSQLRPPQLPSQHLQNAPRPLPQLQHQHQEAQILPVNQEHLETLEQYYTTRRKHDSKMTQKRTNCTATRNHDQSLFDQNRASTSTIHRIVPGPLPQLQYQHQQVQVLPVNQEQLETPEQYYTTRRKHDNKMAQKRTHCSATRNQDNQFPFDQNRASTSTLHRPAAMTTPASIQLHPNDPRRHSVQVQMALAGHTSRPSRLPSTQEENQAMQASQTVHRDRNYSYPNFHKGQDDIWPPEQQ